jgi:hypothetical protein
MIALLRKLVGILGRPLVYTLPPDYQPAGWAFLRGIANTKLDSEVPVPREILGTVALAVLHAIDPYSQTPRSYEEAVEKLSSHKEPVFVKSYDYPIYKGTTIPGYACHPHYYVMGSFTAYPQGDGYWLIQDRYDWHFKDYWSVPDQVAKRIPSWVLSKFCQRYGKMWVLMEMGSLDQITVPYWHRSVVKLADYLNPQDFE